MNRKENKYKHLTLDERIEIQECLAKGMTFKAIARRIGKDPTTISKEVKAHLQTHTNSFVKTEEPCSKLLKAPFVCNSCEKKSRSSCSHPRHIYHAKRAQADYEALWVEAREGIPLTRESFYETEAIISRAVRNGQHVYHAIHANRLPVSHATVYRHIRKGYYSIGPIDLPRAVKFKPRHAKPCEYVPRKAKEGRVFADYLSFVEHDPSLGVTQLDTVIGRPGGKVIMTLLFIQSDFMCGLLMENKTAAEAARQIQGLKLRLNTLGFSFGSLVPLILTDNGGEFSNVSAFENDLEGHAESHLFFCDPNAPYEKPHIEKNHTIFRDIVPSGSSFDGFSQDTVNLIFSHVNAVKRKLFNGKSAYDMFAFTHSAEVAEALGISSIDPLSVVQSPALLR